MARGVITSWIVAITLAATGCGLGGGAKATGDQLNVGIILSLSGSAASFGTLDRNGVELAAKTINDAGGVNGKPVKLTIIDDQTSPDKAVLAADELLTRDHVTAVVGATTGSSTLAIAPIFNRQHVPLLAPVTTVTVTNPATLWVFRTAVSDIDAVRAELAKVSQTVHANASIALIHQDDASGQTAAAYFAEEAPKTGIKIVANEQVATNAVDTTPQLLKVRAANPDAIIIQCNAAVGPLTVKLARQLGLQMPIIGTPGLARATTWVLAGDAASGVLIPTQINPQKPANAAQQNFMKQFHVAYPNRTPDADPTLWDVISYDSLSLIVQAAKNSGGKTDAASLRRGLESIKDYQGAGGAITYSTSGRDGLGPDAIRWVVVRNNRFDTPPQSLGG